MQTKTKKLIVSLSSLVLSGFLLNHYMTVGAEETTTNTIQQSQKEVQYQQRDTKNLVEMVILVRRRTEAVRGQEAKLRGGQLG